MRNGFTIGGCMFAAAIALLFSSSTAFADHLDRPETRRVVRHLEERTDALQDRIEAWIAERRDERGHRAEELIRHVDGVSNALDDLKVQLRSHDEPWDVRDQAQTVIAATADLGHVIEREEFHRDLRGEWEGLRDQANELARHFHLPEIEHR